MGEIGDGDATTLAGQIDLRTEWMARAVAAGKRLGMVDGQVQASINDTAIIDAVAKRLAHLEPGNRDLIQAYRVLWRTHSGTAHGLRWSSQPNTEVFDSLVRGGAIGQVTSGGIDKQFMSAAAPAVLIHRAVELFETYRQP